MTTTTETSARPTVGDAPGPVDEWRRHPADLARLLASSTGLLAVLALTWAEPEAMRGASADLVRLVRRLPDVVQAGTAGVVQLVAVVGPLAVVADLVYRRRLRLAASAVGAAVLAGLATVGLQGWLDDTTPPAVAAGLDDDSWLAGVAFPSPSFIAGLTAASTVLVPLLSRPWRRGAWILLWATIFTRLLTAVAVPLHVAAVVLLGVTVGSLVLIVVGAPVRRVRRHDIRDALADGGVVVGDVEWSGPSTVVGRTDRGVDVAVVVVDRDDRDADLLHRAWRSLRVRGIDEDHLSWSPARTVEHEALTSMLARGAGVRVPEVLAVAATETGAGLLAVRAEPSTPLADLDDVDLDDGLLDRAWGTVARLQERRIAHRRLHLGNLHRVADDVLVADFSHAATSASDTLLALETADPAQSVATLTASLAPHVLETTP